MNDLRQRLDQIAPTTDDEHRAIVDATPLWEHVETALDAYGARVANQAALATLQAVEREIEQTLTIERARCQIQALRLSLGGAGRCEGREKNDAGSGGSPQSLREDTEAS